MAIKIPHIGDLRQNGALQINTPIAQGAGFKDNYTQLLTCRGRLQKLKGSRILDTGEVVISAGWEWVCRFQIAIENVTTKKSIRWVIDNRFFTVSDYEQIDQKRHWYRFILLENE